MTLFWLLCLAMTALAVGGLLLPLLRRRDPARDGGPDPRTERRGLAVFRDQLEEIDRDRERGLLDEDQAESARQEVERRLLAIPEPDEAPAPLGGGAGRALALAIALAVPAAALALYFGLGTPGLPGQPFAERQDTAPSGDIATLADNLSARLAQGGGSAQDWALLARTYAELQRTGPAAQAAAEAIRLGMDDAETLSFHGEMLTAAAGGSVTQDARDSFAQALERDPSNPRALYYAGLALAQDGRLEPALELWTTLAEASAPDAPWLTLLRQQIRRVAGDLGVEPPAIAAQQAPAGGAPVGSTAPGPSAADVAAAQDMSPEERMAFIRSMVEGLAERLQDRPEDLDGWLRLSRAYLVLQERDKAAEALGRAEALAAILPEGAPERAAVAAARRALESGG